MLEAGRDRPLEFDGESHGPYEEVQGGRAAVVAICGWAKRHLQE